MMKMNEQPLKDTIMEMREDLMLSPAGESKPTLRMAHFLKPIANSIHEQPLEFNPFSSSSVFESKELPLKIKFTGWRRTHIKWECWVDQLKPKYESVWKKSGIFDAIMSTKCHILKNQNLLFGVVEKWCSQTNTFVFPFGEATITLEDVMVLGGYPIIGHHVFTKVEDQEMREVEKKLILARQQLYMTKTGNAITSLWMDIFIGKGSEIEHEAFLATWLSIFVFPHKRLVKSSLFSIAIYLARGNPIALAPAILASLYNDLSLLKKTIVDLKKVLVSGDRLPLKVTLKSPFYLVQIWVWERFKNLQPQPLLINHGEPLLFRWHKVQALKIDNVKMALDSTIDDFLWRPYVRYANMCGMFYPNDEIWVPFKKDLDKEMLSFVICLRVSELVGFDSIEQYLPHRVSMQFGMDQDVPSFVPRLNETKSIAWNNYCRPISDNILYFPPRLFEADVTTRYGRWWKQSVLGHDNFVKNIVKRKRSASSRKHRPCVRKANSSGIDVGFSAGFLPNLVDTLIFGKLCNDVPAENSVHDCVKADGNIDAPSISSENYAHDVLVLKSKQLINHCSSASQGESKRFSIRKKVSPSNNVTVAQQDLQFCSDISTQAEAKQAIEEKGRKESDHELVVLLKEQYLKNQEELRRLARRQEEMFHLMDLKEKRDEELRQLLTSVLKNQQPPSCSS